MGELVVFGCVSEDSAEEADQGIDHLAAEHRKRVDEHHTSAEPCRFDSGGKAGDSRTDHADIRCEFVVGGPCRLGDGARFEVRKCVGHAAQRKDPDGCWEPGGR
ncbi:hypothetical protein GCM10018793_27710 [Streptomyces sulfonofaciens]|uniref:Uncharacterized protein n=1 Tax=Streptomyces sulfonofaciens TaxID=68272 RepID=A0A919G600_9ACTN|nr:hypothetical protein GCM10018793_27710 [Streptomyces sulfonofaciens]